MRKLQTKLIISLLALVFLSSCRQFETSFILISKDSSQRIENWLLKSDSTLHIREFYTIQTDSMDWFLDHAVGVVIGGGEDIHPSIYGKEEYVEVCGAFDLFRDSIEMVLINHALQNKVPLLGICRGHQIMNASQGGTLIPDIPTFTTTNINHRSQSDSAHYVLSLKGSWLDELDLDTIWVNSRHHQCVSELSPLFSLAAFAPDGIIESLQISDTLIHPFAVGVQWHPEGLLDAPSMKIAEKFISETKK